MRDGRQDMFPALLLSEGVYKAADVGEAAALLIMETMQRDLPEQLCRLSAVQWSQPHGPQRRAHPSPLRGFVMPPTWRTTSHTSIRL